MEARPLCRIIAQTKYTMMKKFLMMSLFAMCFQLAAFAQQGDQIIGKWLNPSGEGQIQIYKKGSHYFGKLAWIKVPNDESGKPKTDQKNPSEALRSRPLLNLEILKDFTYILSYVPYVSQLQNKDCYIIKYNNPLKHSNTDNLYRL